MRLDPWGLLLAAGALQGLILSLALWRIPRPAPAARVLALLVASFALILVEEFLDITGLQRSLPHTAGLTVGFELLIGPLALLFARTLARGEAPAPRALLHFLPFLAATLLLTPFYLRPGEEKLVALDRDPGGVFMLVVALKSVHLFTYLVWTLWRLSRDLPAARRRRHLAKMMIWYRRAVAAACGLGAISLALYLAGRSKIALPLDSDRLSGLLLTAWIYGIAFAAIIQSRFHRQAAGPTYSTSPLASGSRKALRRRLDELLERDELYRDCQLRLADLAARLGVPPHHLSEVVNRETGRGFNELINGYRVEAAKASLARRESRDRTLLAVAHASGFNSKASFNRAFKRHTGMTPSQYRKSALDE